MTQVFPLSFFNNKIFPNEQNNHEDNDYIDAIMYDPNDNNNTYELIETDGIKEWKLIKRKIGCSYCSKKAWYKPDEIFNEFDICKQIGVNFISNDKNHFIYINNRIRCCEKCFILKHNPSDNKNVYYFSIDKKLTWTIKFKQLRCNDCGIEYSMHVSNIISQNNI